MTTYLLAGGGTAGHVNPMIAIADALRERDATSEIIMLGTSEGLESRLIPAAGYELVTIPKLPFPRRLNRAALAFPRRWRTAVREVRELLRQRHVDVVVGVGGYASAPAYAAARAENVPLAAHEANARPGLANRLAARWTPYVGVAIAGTPLSNATVVGMPLRAEFEQPLRESERPSLRRSFGLDPRLPTIVVTGGSLGARSINEAVARSALGLVASGIQILHITGKHGVARSSQMPGYHTLEYCDRMRDALACSDLVISRAGASTVSEIAALGLPAVFVPYPVGNGEQRFNARPLVDAGAALLVADADFSSEWIGSNVPVLVHDESRLKRMRDASIAHGIRDGRARMLALIDKARGIGAH